MKMKEASDAASDRVISITCKLGACGHHAAPFIEIENNCGHAIIPIVNHEGVLNV